MRRAFVGLLFVAAGAAACGSAPLIGAGDGGDARSEDGGGEAGGQDDADGERDVASVDGDAAHAPVVVVPASPGCQSIDLVVSGGTLFWTDKGHGLVVSLAPGMATPTTLASGEGAPTKLVARAGTSPAETTLFWVDETDKTVRRMAASGGPPVTLATAATEIGGLTVSPDGTRVYFSTAPMISRVPAAGGQAVPAVLEAYNDWPGEMAIVGNQIAFPTIAGGHVLLATLDENDVAMCGKSDGQGGTDMTTCRRIGSSHGGLDSQHILVLGDQLFWSNYTAIFGGPVPERPFQFSPRVTDSGNFEDILGMAGASNTLYFSDRTGDIWRSPTAPMSNPVRLARGQKGPRAVAVDDARVYWSTADCAIASVER